MGYGLSRRDESRPERLVMLLRAGTLEKIQEEKEKRKILKNVEDR